VSFTIDEAWTDRSWYPFLSGPDMGSVFVVRRGVDTGFNDRAALPASLLELDFVTPRVVLDDECNPTGKTTTLGGRTQDVIDWLSSARFLSVGDPQQVTVAGYSGVSVDVTVTGDPGLACGGAQIPGQGRAYLFNSSVLPPGFGGRHVIWDGEKARITALDVGGEAPLVIVARSREQDFDKVIPWATDQLDNTTVAPAP
jgi:hypothetical protein